MTNNAKNRLPIYRQRLSERITVDDGNEIFAELERRARYALNSHNRDLVCEIFGMAKMARNLRVITKEQFYKLNELIVAKGLNNPAIWSEVGE